MHPCETAAFAYGKSVSLDGPTQKHLSCSFVVLLRNIEDDGVLKEQVSFRCHAQADVGCTSHGAEHTLRVQVDLFMSQKMADANIVYIHIQVTLPDTKARLSGKTQELCL
jgi:hypothetical protein